MEEEGDASVSVCFSFTEEEGEAPRAPCLLLWYCSVSSDTYQSEFGPIH